MISVLLPHRNADATLSEAVLSVLSDMSEEDELILIDDGGSSGFAHGDRRIVPLRTEGQGIAKALNAGLAIARGQYIARMDADDVSLPGRLRSQREALDADGELGVIATRVELFGDPGPGMQRYIEWQNALVTKEEHARAIFIESPVCHPSVMMRRSALVDGYESGPFAEDYDLWLRMIERGWGIAKIPQVLLRWRIHAANTTKQDPRMSIDAMRALRARYLARKLDRPFAIWGAGPFGRRLARELETHGRYPELFVDIDPRKVGRTRRGKPIVSPDDLPDLFVVIAVAAPGARDQICEFLKGRDYVCAA